MTAMLQEVVDESVDRMIGATSSVDRMIGATSVMLASHSAQLKAHSERLESLGGKLKEAAERKPVDWNADGEDDADSSLSDASLVQWSVQESQERRQARKARSRRHSRCPQDHYLRRSVAKSAGEWQCDCCGAMVKHRVVFGLCRHCDWAACSACLSRAVKDLHETIWV